MELYLFRAFQITMYSFDLMWKIPGFVDITIILLLLELYAQNCNMQLFYCKSINTCTYRCMHNYYYIAMYAHRCAYVRIHTCLHLYSLAHTPTHSLTTCTHTHTHTRTHTYTYVATYSPMHIHSPTQTNAHKYVCMHIQIYS